MSNNEKISDYITFPRTFEKYAWYKPIIVFILATIIMFILGGLMTLAASQVFGVDFIKFVLGKGIDGLNSAIPIIFTDLFIFMFIPGLYIASKIVKDRPFSSYSSSRGGWNFKLYLKALIIPLILFLIYQCIEIAVIGGKGNIIFDCAFYFSASPIDCRRIHVSRNPFANIRIMVQDTCFSYCYSSNNFWTGPWIQQFRIL